MTGGIKPIFSVSMLLASIEEKRFYPIGIASSLRDKPADCQLFLTSLLERIDSSEADQWTAETWNKIGVTLAHLWGPIHQERFYSQRARAQESERLKERYELIYRGICRH